MRRLLVIGIVATGLALLATLSLAAGATGTATTARVGASADTQQPGLYIALGTSVSVGEGASSVNKSFVRLYYGYLQSNGSGVTDLANVASSGFTTTNIRNLQLPNAVASIDDPSTDTKAVTINFGLNDLRFDAKCETASAPACPLAGNLRAILTTLNTALATDPGDESIQEMDSYNPDIGTPLESDTRQLLLGSDGKVDCSGTGAALGVNDLSHCISLEQGAKPVDVLPIFDAAGPEFIASDHIHPSDAGHLAIAKAFGGAATPTTPPPPPPPPPPPAVRGCVVPKVTGMPLGKAKKTLATAHCSTGRVRRAFSAKVKRGRVVSEHPSAGTHLANGGKVNLVVSLGRKG
jgi:hypothetical protein